MDRALQINSNGTSQIIWAANYNRSDTLPPKNTVCPFFNCMAQNEGRGVRVHFTFNRKAMTTGSLFWRENCFTTFPGEMHASFCPYEIGAFGTINASKRKAIADGLPILLNLNHETWEGEHYRPNMRFSEYKRWCDDHKKHGKNQFASLSIKSVADLDRSLRRILTLAAEAGRTDVLADVKVGYKGTIEDYNVVNLAADQEERIPRVFSLLDSRFKYDETAHCHRLVFRPDKDKLDEDNKGLIIRGQDAGNVQLYMRIPHKKSDGTDNKQAQSEIKTQLLSAGNFDVIGRVIFDRRTDAPGLHVVVEYPTQISYAPELGLSG